MQFFSFFYCFHPFFVVYIFTMLIVIDLIYKVESLYNEHPLRDRLSVHCASRSLSWTKKESLQFFLSELQEKHVLLIKIVFLQLKISKEKLVFLVKLRSIEAAFYVFFCIRITSYKDFKIVKILIKNYNTSSLRLVTRELTAPSEVW
jgi:hypothetical protein